GMPESRGGIVQVVGGEDERRGARAHLPPEGLETRAGARREPVEIDRNGGGKPGKPGGKPAHGMLERRIGERRSPGRGVHRGEEARQRGFELGGRIALALRREEQRRSVGLALPATQSPFAPMAEAKPAAFLGERSRLDRREE